MGQIPIDEVLVEAITREEQSYAFYMKLRNIVEDSVSKDTLSFMANEELQHKAFLEKYRRGEFKEAALSLREVVDGKVVEVLGSPEITERLEHKDIFLIAAQREKASHEFYTALAAVQPAGTVKNLFLKLAQEELAHKDKAEYLYCNAAFPQTAGG